MITWIYTLYTGTPDWTYNFYAKSDDMYCIQHNRKITRYINDSWPFSEFRVMRISTNTRWYLSIIIFNIDNQQVSSGSDCYIHACAQDLLHDDLLVYEEIIRRNVNSPYCICLKKNSCTMYIILTFVLIWYRLLFIIDLSVPND